LSSLFNFKIQFPKEYESMDDETKQLLSKELLKVQDRLSNETRELIDYAKMVDVLAYGFRSIEMDDREHMISCLYVIKTLLIDTSNSIKEIEQMVEVLREIIVQQMEIEN